MKPVKTWTIRASALVGALTIGIAMAAPVAQAGTGAEYGQHVRACAQSEGFGGDHNPGMHTGYAGWDPSHTC